MKNKAFLSSLGTMGCRHLLGLLRAGFEVTGFDPFEAAYNKAFDKIKAANLDPDQLKWVTQIPADNFDVAVFSETSRFRQDNIETFLQKSTAQKFLLEKPLSSNPEGVEAVKNLFVKKGVSNDRIHLNFARRVWPITQKLKEMCAGNKQVHFSVNGGAMGLGCNGIHLIDMFEYLCPGEKIKVNFSDIDTQAVKSGRGVEFQDFGGTFVLSKGPHRMTMDISSDSSAPAMVSIRGDHFICWIDEGIFHHKIWQRDAGSRPPNYFTGWDYKPIAEGVLELPGLDLVTQRWTSNFEILPTIDQGLSAHEAIFDLLKTGGNHGPYCFT